MLTLLQVTFEPQVLQPIEDGDEIVTVTAAFKPLLLETMTKDMDDTVSKYNHAPHIFPIYT